MSLRTPEPPVPPGDSPGPVPWRIPTGGVILIVLGGIFLYGLASEGRPGRGMRTLWPLILVAIGLTQLINARFRDGGGFVLTLLGAAFLLFTLDVLPWTSMEQWWPVALILAGVGMMWGRGSRKHR